MEKRFAPLFDHGLSLISRTLKEEDIDKFEPLKDIVTNSFIGSRSLFENLKYVINDEKFYNAAAEQIRSFTERFKQVNFAVGEWLNADSFELALALLEMGLKVAWTRYD